MPTVTITRSNEYLNRFRSIYVYIDGQKVGKVFNGETVSYEVPKGRHTVRAKIDWCGSKELILDMQEDEIRVLQLKGFKSFRYLKYFALPIFAALVADIFIQEDLLTYITIPFSVICLGWMLYIFTIGRNKYLVLSAT